MGEASLRQLEHDVEAARARLAEDLSTLRSPNTLSEFTDELKHEALEAKDALVEKARSTAQSAAQGIVDDLKAKAAANPSAALVIGAGIAWRLLRRPPIATALIGAGLFSLLRTPSIPDMGEQVDHFGYARERLKEQAGELAQKVGELGAATAETVKEKTLELGGTVEEKVGNLGGGTSTMVDDMRQTSGEAAQRVAATADRASLAVQGVLSNQEMRDKFLLGAAGVAIAAAMAFAYQRRDEERRAVE
jgi:predicted nuclease with TOPRIM domain